MQSNVEFHAAGHHRVGAYGDLSGRIIRIVVGADGGGYVGEQPRIDHSFRAETELLGRWNSSLMEPLMRLRRFASQNAAPSM